MRANCNSRERGVSFDGFPYRLNAPPAHFQRRYPSVNAAAVRGAHTHPPPP